MDYQKLQKANSIKKQIDEHQEALNCFEWPGIPDHGLKEPLTRHPQLIIEVDDCDDCREQIKLPMVLSNELIGFLKSVIIENKRKLESEFESL